MPVTEIKIVGHKVICLVDCGATISLLNDKIFQKLKTDDRITHLTIDANIKSVTGDDLIVTDCVSLPVIIGNKEVRQRFYVVKNLLSEFYDAILGYDILKSGNYKICFDTNTLTSGNSVSRIRDAISEGINMNEAIYAYMPKRMTLKPGESKTVHLALDKTATKGDIVKIFSCIKNPNVKFINDTCSIEKDRQISVQITNISTKPIPVNKSTRIAAISNNFDTRNIEHIKQLRRQELQESDFNLSHLDTETKSKLLALLMEFADIFSKRLYTIGRTEAITPNLQVDINKLPSLRPFRFPQALQEEINQQLKELEAANIIERSSSHVSSPLLIIKKKNPSGDPNKQKHRIVIDYREVNANLKYPRYKLPIIQHLLDKLRGNKIYTTLDLHASFWQVPLRPEDRDMTTFSSQFGNFRFVCLPQGINMASECFSQLADQILAPITHLHIANFLDDFCAGATTVAQMLDKLRQLFERFRLFGITLNPEKCTFLQPEITFLGHQLNEYGIKPIAENTIRIKDFPTPNTVKKVRRFLGMAAYYRKFIKNFSLISAPLTDLTKRSSKFKWSSEAQFSFDTLKEALSHPPILAHPDFDKTFVLSTDSSKFAVSGVLQQEDAGGILRPIAYYSKKLNDAQRRYTIMQKEMLAVIEGLAAFNHYLYGRHFIIRCDNKAVTELKALDNPGDRIVRWFAKLETYNYTFEHIKSEENIIADTLSRDFYKDSKNNINSETKRTTQSDLKDSKHKESLRKEIINEISDYDLQTSTLTTNNNKKKIQKLSNIAGLANLGNSCFMNAALQSISYLPPLLAYLSKITVKCTNSDNCMICMLNKHLESVFTSSKMIVEPIEFYRNLEKIGDQFRKDVQQDSHDFLRQTINKLEFSATRHPITEKFNCLNNIKNPIKQIFEGCFQSEIKCMKCDKSSLAFDPYMDISLNITRDIQTLEKALEYFTQTENLADNYRCFNCKENTKATKKMSILNVPQILTLHMNRFEFASHNTTKLTKHISYPETLNLTPFTVENKIREPLNYALSAVIIHSGNYADGGHYFSYVKDLHNTWYEMNDSEVQKVTLDTVLNQEAYILIYVLTNNMEQTPNLNPCVINSIQIDLPTITEVQQAQLKDEKLSDIISALKSRRNTDNHKYANYFLKDGLLMHKAFIPRIKKSTDVQQIVIPDVYKPHILTAKHISHLGVFKTYNAIREKYFWENLFRDTKHFVQTCKDCMSYKSIKKLPPVPIQRHYIPSGVNQYVSADFVGPFNVTNKGNRYILTFIDHFSKFIKLYPVPRADTKCSVQCLMDYIGTFGLFNYYLTDKASCFTSDTFTELCKIFGVKKLKTTPQRPQCNGSSEKLNSNIKKSLAIFAQDTAQWDEYTDYYSLIYNNTLHSTINQKPSYLQLAYEPLLPNEILDEPRTGKYVSHQNFVQHKASQLQYVNEKVKECLENAAQKREVYQHAKAKYRDFYPGQLAYLHTRDCDRFRDTTKRRSNIGPFRIVKRHNKVNYTIVDAHEPTKPQFKVHCERLIPYTQRNPKLSLFHTLCSEVNKKPHVSQQDTNSKKPHAVFDDDEFTDLLYSNTSPSTTKVKTDSFHTPTNQSMDMTLPQDENLALSPIHFADDPDVHNSESSNDSEQTIIYDANVSNSQTSQSMRSPYDLRDIQPRYSATRFLDWALQITE